MYYLVLLIEICVSVIYRSRATVHLMQAVCYSLTCVATDVNLQNNPSIS